MEQRQYLKTIQYSAQTQLDIIGNILDMSKIKAQKMSCEKTLFSLREAIESVSMQFTSPQQNKGLSLTLDVLPHLPNRYWGDERKIVQVLNNLINNAFKFTSEGSISIHCSIQRRDTNPHWVVIRIEDTGIGIAPNKLNTIFEHFVQADDSTTRRYGGTGLGLSICRDLCQLMEGKLSVKSTLGKGSVFTVELPLESDLDQGEDPLPSNGEHWLVASDQDHETHIFSQQLKHWGFQVSVVSLWDELYSQLYQDNAYTGLIVSSEFLREHLGNFLQHIQRHASPPPLYMIGHHDFFESDMAKKYSQLYAKVLTPIFYRATFIQTLKTQLSPSIWTPITQYEKIPEQTFEEEMDIPHRQQLKILMAEDNVTNQVVAKEMFRSLGLTLDIANDGQEALDLFEKKEYHMVFMDCLMPRKDGYETSQIIRAGKHQCSIPIIALTANASHADQQKSIDIGMNEHLTKPINLDVLKQVILRWTQNLHFVPINTSEPKLEIKTEEPDAKFFTPPMDMISSQLSSSSSEKVKGDQQGSIFDYQKVLKITGGKEMIAEKVIVAFLKSAPDCLGTLQEGLHQNDREAIHRQAHTLKSSTAYVGALRLTEIYKDLDARSRTQASFDLSEEERNLLSDELTLIHDITLDHMKVVLPHLF
jgi:CheY-like chemotaxis protein/HPt (histidine-containing phosphotransfer) domain-containing protein